MLLSCLALSPSPPHSTQVKVKAPMPSLIPSTHPSLPSSLFTSNNSLEFAQREAHPPSRPPSLLTSNGSSRSQSSPPPSPPSPPISQDPPLHTPLISLPANHASLSSLPPSLPYLYFEKLLTLSIVPTTIATKPARITRPATPYTLAFSQGEACASALCSAHHIAAGKINPMTVTNVAPTREVNEPRLGIRAPTRQVRKTSIARINRAWACWVERKKGREEEEVAEEEGSLLKLLLPWISSVAPLLLSSSSEPCC